MLLFLLDHSRVSSSLPPLHSVTGAVCEEPSRCSHTVDRAVVINGNDLKSHPLADTPDEPTRFRLLPERPARPRVQRDEQIVGLKESTNSAPGERFNVVQLSQPA